MKVHAATDFTVLAFARGEGEIMKAKLWKLFVGVVATAILTACHNKGSGGAETNSTTTTPPSNNWDSMIWDQGKWQ